jgi:hypothetical protein
MKFSFIVSLIFSAVFLTMSSSQAQQQCDSHSAPDVDETYVFSASHTGAVEIVGWAGPSLEDVMAVEDLKARVADFEGLSLAIDTFSSIGMAEVRRYEFDRAGNELRLYANGQSLIINGESATLSADYAVESDPGQAHIIREAPRYLPCRLYSENVQDQTQAQDQIQQPEEIVVRCDEALSRYQTSARPREERTEVIHVVLLLSPVIEDL